jgi:hypothetical protein
LEGSQSDSSHQDVELDEADLQGPTAWRGVDQNDGAPVNCAMELGGFLTEKKKRGEVAGGGGTRRKRRGG